MIHFYFGKETFLVKENADSLKKKFIQDNPGATVDSFIAGEDSIGEIRKSLSLGGGLFSRKKMIQIKDAFDLPAGQQEELKGVLKPFASSQDLQLLITQPGKPSSKNKFFVFLKKYADSRESSGLADRELRSWIEDRIREKSGGTLGAETPVFNYLAANYGKDLWRLDSELEKLVSFRINSAGSGIKEEDLALFCQKALEVKIFDFVDSIGVRNKRRSLQLMNSLLSSKEDPFYIFSMIVYQLRNLARVDYCKRKGIFDQKAIASRTGLHPYVVKKTQQQLSNFGTSQIKSIYNLCFKLDNFSKTGKIEIKDALKDLVVKI
ncbi:MAG: DNA polymerase III subunit delta [Candidatus Moranbacteria bacterium]|nr:DNA polymerase III subunit delta [Candidatus Moranbacteria bacterium]